jgi:hypothetical protein
MAYRLLELVASLMRYGQNKPIYLNDGREMSYSFFVLFFLKKKLGNKTNCREQNLFKAITLNKNRKMGKGRR